MKKVLKIFSILLAIVCCVATIQLVTMASTPTISASTVEGNTGGEVNVDISISGNPGLSYLSIKVGYDDSQVSLTNIANKDLIGGSFQEGPAEDNPIILLWANSDSATDGVLVTLTFKIEEDASLGSTPITVSVLEAYDTSDDMNDVAIGAFSGKIEITCGHLGTTTKYVATSATCISEGNSEYTICDVCKEVISGEKIIYPVIEHDLEAHGYVAPTHTTEGNIAYWECGSCEQYFSDADGTNVIEDKESVVLDKLAEHDYSSEWQKDENQHWKVCECSSTAELADHVYDNACDTHCNTCGYEREIEHTWETEYAWDAESHWMECSVCGEKKDEVAHKCDAEVVGEKYLKTAATDSTAAVYYKSCTVCGGMGSDTFQVTLSDGKIVVSSEKGFLGKEVSVSISLEDNPGIAIMLLSVQYDTSVLKLKSVTDLGNLGDVGHSNDYNANPYTLYWMNFTSDNFTYNGEVVTLTFEVLEGATLGDTEISVSYDYRNAGILNSDMQSVNFDVQNGVVEVMDVILGDVNGDGKVNPIDNMFLARYIAKWSGYTEENVDIVAADVNADGKVNPIDNMILARYIAKWSGYTELPYGSK